MIGRRVAVAGGTLGLRLVAQNFRMPQLRQWRPPEPLVQPLRAQLPQQEPDPTNPQGSTDAGAQQEDPDQVVRVTGLNLVPKPAMSQDRGPPIQVDFILPVWVWQRFATLERCPSPIDKKRPEEWNDRPEDYEDLNKLAAEPEVHHLSAVIIELNKNLRYI